MVKAPNATSNGGATRPASGIKAKVHTPNKGSQAALITRLSVRAFAFMPDAGRVAPPLEVAFGAFTILQQLTHRVSYILHKHAATH